ncbi:acyl-CoA dehydrogenase C-terminal domain-containing protein [Indioceanicola profundi]|uniref:acyl-CoA dehydrogenase C-terminal domain-containing protein n=1 Tax=Indioceanicola profundi TaxID=2220096 RepID=UPI000E6AA12B|nr:acyl-CoA dehydrogenase C-terminal domain-containing protein [Indioceanicola profundi]
MPVYKAPLEDIGFVLNDVLNAQSLTQLPGLGDASPDLISAVLEEAAKLCENELQPLNRSGHEEGCHYENGVVRTPKGFKEAYDKYVEGGWQGLSFDPEYGGQGLPHTLTFVMEELMNSANMAFAMYPGLTQGAMNAIHTHANEELKAQYLPKMASGEWSGTMCLTEPHCGTDLGLIKTKAVPAGDGSYKVTGTKIFISAGEHDLTSNIIHLVLAKLPDAPAGTKGISLFLVPKFLPDENNEPGQRNGVMCGSIEHKMGIMANATCVMNFDDATGWLVGEPHKGMRAMFTMMNAARLGVGMQGLGIAAVAYQNGLAYAKDRLQGRSLGGAKAPEKPADPIIVHPDVRKNLLAGKAFVEGGRALGYWVGMLIDMYERHPDPKVQQEAEDFVALLTPVVKAYFTDMGYEVATNMQQVYGGHGYIREWGMEQFVRDARIAMIYEGANGIQALDLVGRKMPQNMGRLLRRFFHPMQAELESSMSNPALMEFVIPLSKAFGKLQQATAIIAQKGMARPDEAGAASTDYLRIFGLVSLGWMWLKMVKVAQEKMAEGSDGKQSFYDAKIKTARFFMEKMLPEADARFKSLMAGGKTLMSLDADQF